VKVSTSLHTLTDFGNDTKPFLEALSEIAELGFDGVMLLHRPHAPRMSAGESPGCCLLDLAGSDIAAVKRSVREAGLEITCLHLGCTDVSSPEATLRSTQALAEGIELGHNLGTSLVIPNAGSAPRALMPVDEKEQLIQRVARVMSDALGQARPEARLAIDVHFAAVIESVDDCLRLFELADDPRVGITLNIGHMTTNRQQGWRLIKEFPERVHAIAWKDHLLTPPPGARHPVFSVELGTGDSPFGLYVQAVKESGSEFVHLITFEHVPFEQKHEALKRSLTFWRRLWV